MTADDRARIEAITRDAVLRELFDEPRCPKQCDVATPPERIRPGVYVCVCCGTEFRWNGPAAR